jgi:hypothetical protein
MEKIKASIYFDGIKFDINIYSKHSEQEVYEMIHLLSAQLKNPASKQSKKEEFENEQKGKTKTQKW